MGRVIWATESCEECAERFIYVEDELICIHHKGKTVPSFLGKAAGQRVLTQGSRGSCPAPFSCLGAPGLLATPTLKFHPVCLTSLLCLYPCLYPCLSQKEITLEQLFQRGQSGHSRMSFHSGSPGSKSTSTRVSCLWPSLQIPTSRPFFTA